ncbi:MAG: sialate O-acetylesterase [Victivallales bacterium]
MRIEKSYLEHAVLQRGEDDTCSAVLPFTHAQPGEKITLSWRRREGTFQILRECTADENGAGTAALTGIPAGGPYDIRLSSEYTGEQLISDVLVGDVWLLGGQSNMCGVGKLSEAETPDGAIRVFGFGNRWRIAEGRLHDIQNCCDEVYFRSRELSLADDNFKTLGVGPGHSFAKRLHEATGVPQGVIAGAIGAACLDDWNPRCRHGGKNGNYYGALLERFRLAGGQARGLFWYQGEADTREERCKDYTVRTRRLFRAFRRDSGNPDLAVVMVQLSRYVCDPDDPKNLRWALVREQQRLFQKPEEKIAVVPSLDLEVIDGLHLTADSAGELGRRGAEAMLTLHGFPGAQPMPAELESIVSGWDSDIMSPTVIVRFRSLMGKLRSDGRPTGFAVFHDGKIANAVSYVELNGNKAIVHLSRSERCTKPAEKFTIAYGGLCSCYVNITDEAHRPLPGFGPLEIQKGNEGR